MPLASRLVSIKSLLLYCLLTSYLGLFSPFPEIVRICFSVANLLIYLVCSYPRTKEDELKANNVWLKGHTGKSSVMSTSLLLVLSINIDTGTVTILYSQPIAALQILAKDCSWKWVRHIENALVRNDHPEGRIDHPSHYIYRSSTQVTPLNSSPEATTKPLFTGLFSYSRLPLFNSVYNPQQSCTTSPRPTEPHPARCILLRNDR